MASAEHAGGGKSHPCTKATQLDDFLSVFLEILQEECTKVPNWVQPTDFSARLERGWVVSPVFVEPG